MPAAEYTLEEAFAAIAARHEPGIAVREAPLAAARGRVLARALVAPRDLPERDISAMDGYAVRAQDLVDGVNRLAVAGRVLAGELRAAPVAAGTCVRIMTGAAMPPGADAVVVIEAAEPAGEGFVGLVGPIAAGTNRRRRAEHVRSGESVLPAGRRLGSAEIALAAALGFERLAVYARLRVGVLSTGNELRDPPATLPDGGAYDSNRPMLLAALDAAGMETVDLGICPDDSAALGASIARAHELGLDAVVASGGAALGDADVVRRLEGVEFVPLGIRPGRGVAVARLVHGAHSALLLGLPGNAVAAYVVLHALALPVLARLGGADARPPAPILLPAACELRARAGRIEFRRARLVAGPDGRRAVEPLPEQGSAMIRSVCNAEALIEVGPAPTYRAGDLVRVYLVESFESPRRV